MRIQNNSGQYKLTLPKDLIKAKGWKGGQEVVVTLDSNGDLVIKEINITLKKLKK